MKTVSILLLSACAFGQFGGAILPENATTKVSDHVWAIMGFPNIAIVVGSNATLVVDTGLGPRNGQIIMREVQKLAKSQKLFLTTTHFHPEHAGGEAGFPANTVLLRPSVQQDEMNQNGMQMVETFSNMNAQNKELLAGVGFRQPDVVFDGDMKVDLGGGVTARLLWTGGGHTLGDEFIFVEPDRTLMSGDLVEKDLVPAIFGEASSAQRWLTSLDKIAPLNPRLVVPDHGPLGDGSLVAKQKTFMTETQTRALALKREGKSADEAAAIMTAEMKTKYPSYTNPNGIANYVKRVYSED